MKKLLMICIVLLGVLSAQHRFEDAYAHYKAKEYKKALKLFKQLVREEDDYDAAYILGYMYEHGEGVAPNMIEATKYYKIASKGYYYQLKNNPVRDIHKEQKKLVGLIEKPADSQTLQTIQQYAESLYNVRAHKANYFLPLSYRYDSKDYSYTGYHDPKKVEIEFQVSIKYDFGVNTFGLDEFYTFAYTQRSFWQAYAKSAFFRESNYNPEFFITFPVDYKLYKATKIGFAHQSNGRGAYIDENKNITGPERSWNYAYGTFVFQTGMIFTELKLWYRFHDKIDYNPDLIDYVGHGHLKFLLPYKKHFATVKLRSNFSGASSVEVHYSYPISSDLFFYVKTFNGYGESLIDYDSKVQKVGMGLSISR